MSDLRQYTDEQLEQAAAILGITTDSLSTKLRASGPHSALELQTRNDNSLNASADWTYERSSTVAEIGAESQYTSHANVGGLIADADFANIAWPGQVQLLSGPINAPYSWPEDLSFEVVGLNTDNGLQMSDDPHPWDANTVNQFLYDYDALQTVPHDLLDETWLPLTSNFAADPNEMLSGSTRSTYNSNAGQGSILDARLRKRSVIPSGDYEALFDEASAIGATAELNALGTLPTHSHESLNGFLPSHILSSRPSTILETPARQSAEEAAMVVTGPRSHSFGLDVGPGWTSQGLTSHTVPEQNQSLPPESHVDQITMSLATNIPAETVLPQPLDGHSNTAGRLGILQAGTQLPTASSASTSTSNVVRSVRPLPALAPKPQDRVRVPANRIYANCDLSQPFTTQRTLSKPTKGPFKDDRIRKETELTRKITACLRCRGHRNRCRPDPQNPKGPCLTCQQLAFTVNGLPCLRYKVTDSNLFRTGIDHITFYKNHPMVGSRYGDFHLTMQWAEGPEKTLEITQDCGPICYLKVREFYPPYEPDALDLKGRPMYYIPWAISNADEAVRAMNTYLDQSMHVYPSDILDESDQLVWDVFHAALINSAGPKPVKVLQEVLRLWVACRFIEGRWRCCGADNLGSESLKNPFRPEEWISPPPYIDYQIGSIIMHRILGPLRQSMLKSLQALILANKSENWYIVFLTTFILLHNYEVQMLFQRQYSAKRQATLRYLDMSVVRATHSGAKTILAHYHSCCKGQVPFSSDFDWDSPQIRKMASLNSEQVAFMKRFRNQVNLEAEHMKSVNRSDRYEARFWFISQLFEDGWTPRDTHEFSPAA